MQAKGKGKQKQQHAHSGAIREIPATAALALQREHARITCFPYTSVQKSLHKNVMTAKSFSNTALTQARQDIRDGIRLRKQGDQTTGETLSANLANERGERGEEYLTCPSRIAQPIFAQPGSLSGLYAAVSIYHTGQAYEQAGHGERLRGQEQAGWHGSTTQVTLRVRSCRAALVAGSRAGGRMPAVIRG